MMNPRYQGQADQRPGDVFWGVPGPNQVYHVRGLTWERYRTISFVSRQARVQSYLHIDDIVVSTSIASARHAIEEEMPGRCGWLRHLYYRVGEQDDYCRVNSIFSYISDLLVLVLPECRPAHDRVTAYGTESTT